MFLFFLLLFLLFFSLKRKNKPPAKAAYSFSRTLREKQRGLRSKSKVDSAFYFAALSVYIRTADPNGSGSEGLPGGRSKPRGRGNITRSAVGKLTYCISYSCMISLIYDYKEGKNTVNIQADPFCILGVSCCDDRQAITGAAEEMSLTLGQDVCIETQNALLDPKKRLSAELDWFIDSDDSAATSIRHAIQNGTSLSTDGLPPLSKLNTR